MYSVESRHPPGAIVFTSGEILRYADAMASRERLAAPSGSADYWKRGCLVSRSINTAFRAAMADPALHWVWIMGDDHTYDPDIILRLLDRDEPVVAPLCVNRAPPFFPTIHQRIEGLGIRVKPLSEMPTSGLYTLAPNETCGDSGVLIRRPVLEAIGDPWYDRPYSGARAADDQLFVARLAKAGYPVKIDCEVVIGHIGPCNLTPTVRDGQWVVRATMASRHMADISYRPSTPEEIAEHEAAALEASEAAMEGVAA